MFSDVIPGDWYDGPIWGIAAGRERNAWAFALLAVDGEALDWRLYCAAPLSPAVLAGAAELGARLWSRGGETDLGNVQDRFHDLWSGAGAPELVILTPSLGGPLDRVRTLATPELRQACIEILGSARLHERPSELNDFESRILDREDFLRVCERFFGPVEFRDLDDPDQADR